MSDQAAILANTCNYCILNRIKAEAKAEGNRVSIRPGTGQLGGVNVYVHPDGFAAQLLKEDTPAHDLYFKVWFMAVGDHCTC